LPYDQNLGDKTRTLHRQWNEGIFENKAFIETFQHTINLKTSFQNVE
jgi:hypothetical protein